MEIWGIKWKLKSFTIISQTGKSMEGVPFVEHFLLHSYHNALMDPPHNIWLSENSSHMTYDMWQITI